MKRNKLYTVNSYNKNQFDKNIVSNIYSDGGSSDEEKSNFFKDNKAWAGVASSAGKVVGDIIGGGKTSSAGQAFNTIGDIAGNIPVYGGFIKGAAGILGGISNGLFGSKLNKENIAQFENQNDIQNRTSFDASSNEELLNNFANSTILNDVSRKEVGSDGLFSNKAKNLTKKINKNRQIANAHTIAALNEGINSLDSNNDFNLMSTFAAYGGAINKSHNNTNYTSFNSNPTINHSFLSNNKKDNNKYLQGQIYDLDEDEIQRLINEGYQIQYE